MLQQWLADDKKKLIICLRINIAVILLGCIICITHADFNFIKIGPRDDLYMIGVKVNTYFIYLEFAMYSMLMQIALLFTEEFALPVIEFTVYNPQCDAIEGFVDTEMLVYTVLIFITKGALKGLKIYLVTESLDSIILLFLAEELTTVYTVSLLCKTKRFIPKNPDLFRSEANMIGQVFKSIFSF
jgi:hypothetical protein